MECCSVKLPFQTEFSIISSQKEIIEQIYISFGRQYIEKNRVGSSNIIFVKSKNDQYLISYKNVTISTDYPIAKIQNIIRENTYYNDQYLFMHGAAVAYQHKATIFLAPTLGGKTTLATFLIENGLGYISEDCMIINTSNMTIYPCNTPLHLRPDSLNILKKSGIGLDELPKINCRDSERLIYLPRNCVKHHLPIQNIFILARNNSYNKTILIPEIKRIDAYFKSLFSSGLIMGARNHIVQLAKKESYLLMYKDMNFVINTIKTRRLYEEFD